MSTNKPDVIIVVRFTTPTHTVFSSFWQGNTSGHFESLPSAIFERYLINLENEFRVEKIIDKYYAPKYEYIDDKWVWTSDLRGVKSGE